MKNTTKVWIFLALMCLFSLILGYKLGDRLGLLLAFLISTLFLYLLVSSHHPLTLRQMHAKELEGQDPWNLNERVAHWAHKIGLPSPRVFIVDSPTALAFSVHHPWGWSAICVSTGLLDKLSPEEVEAVLSHQVCSLLRIDRFLFFAGTIVTNSLLGLGHLLDQMLQVPAWKPIAFLKNRKIFTSLLTPIAWFFVRLQIRDRSYFQNDDLAVQLLPQRKILAQVLWKLESLNQARPVEVPHCSSHLFMVNPRGLTETHWYYVTHPKMDLRLKRLIGSEYF